MEAGLRYSQPPQAVAAFQELSTEHLSRSAWTIRNPKLFDRHHSGIKRVSFRDSLFSLFMTGSRNKSQVSGLI